MHHSKERHAQRRDAHVQQRAGVLYPNATSLAFMQPVILLRRGTARLKREPQWLARAVGSDRHGVQWQLPRSCTSLCLHCIQFKKCTARHFSPTLVFSKGLPALTSTQAAQLTQLQALIASIFQPTIPCCHITKQHPGLHASPAVSTGIIGGWCRLGRAGAFHSGVCRSPVAHLPRPLIPGCSCYIGYLQWADPGPIAQFETGRHLQAPSLPRCGCTLRLCRVGGSSIRPGCSLLVS